MKNHITLRYALSIYLLSCFFLTRALSQDLAAEYSVAWQKFYPTKALSEGIRNSVFHYEDYSEENITKWIHYNEETLRQLSNSETDRIDPIDSRLLKVQVQSELDNYVKIGKHKTSLLFYTEAISKSIEPILTAHYLLLTEKSELTCQRLIAVRKLCEAAEKNLIQVPENELAEGMETLRDVLEFYRTSLPKSFEEDTTMHKCTDFNAYLSAAEDSIQRLMTFAATVLKTVSVATEAVLGQEEYTRRLKLYTDSELSPDELARMALKEIETVRTIMAEVSTAYLKTHYQQAAIMVDDNDLILKALADMEKDAPLNGAEYLEFWNELAGAAMKFIAENEIATLPKNHTLEIKTAPESAGAAARIGWVESAPPFDPDPMTTLYVPSIPDTLPQQEQIDFWASFNKPFNRMIVIHELFPGHYMQLKISRETPHPIRLLFPYGIYIEGWATFTEKVLLDAGWEAENQLTLLAHLRKRLENANRAYTSVQVHCKGWTKEQVLKFSTETSLLAPQFAKSLWGRIMNSPLQLTSYYLGGAQFTELLAVEKNRLGNQFDLKFFMDTIMKAGPIPIDEFYHIFSKMAPN